MGKTLMNKAIPSKTTYRYMLVCLLLLASLAGMRWLWLEVLFPTDASFRAEAGVLDLRGIDLQEQDVLTLDGQWEWYPDELLTSSQLQLRHVDAEARHIQVPGRWGGLTNDSRASSIGYGTYRLRIVMDPLEQPIMFWFKSIQTSAEIEVNGHALGGVGQVADNKPGYSPHNRPFKIAYAEQGGTEIELLVRVANFDSPLSGGITRSVRFGTQAAISAASDFSIAFQLTLVLFMLLHGLYTCIVYLYRPRDRSLFFTGIVFLSVALAVFSGHDKLLLLWLPVEYGWAIKIRVVALLWQNVCLVIMYRRFSGIERIGRGLSVYIAVVAALTVVIAVSPAAVVNVVVDAFIFLIVYLISYLWFAFVVGKMIVQKQADKDIQLLLITGICIISNLGWSTLDSLIDKWTVYYPIDIIIAGAVFSTYWFKKYLRKSDEIVELYEQLKIADKMKDRFLANTSHELRTPLHGIMNITSGVYNREKDKLDESSRNELELVGTVSRRMARLIDDLLDVARLQEQRVALRLEPLGVQAVVPGVVAMLRHMAEGKPIELQVHVSDTMPLVMADEKRLVQIVYNLLHNALKYTERGVISISAEARAGRAEIYVADTGVGMDDKTQTEVFTPYVQGAYGISDARGIGLGLSICKQLVELHDGELTVESQPGLGSTFRFTLPLADEGAAMLSPEAVVFSEREAAPTMPGYEDMRYPDRLAERRSGSDPLQHILPDGVVRILAVDDDPLNLNVLAGILSHEPYELTMVYSAQEVLQALDTGKWDLLIAEVMMPQMSGYELTERVRERFSVSELPVLLLTARTAPADIYTGFLAGANDYVAKPADAVELKYRIRSLIALKQSVHDRLQIEAAYMQAQIQPHFLFNALNSLIVLSDIDPDKMRRFGEAFTSFLRISFDYLNRGETVRLARELELVKAYLYIEKERFADRLHIVWDVQDDMNVMLPPLSIQPLIENAVKHGAMSRAVGGTVCLRVTEQAGGMLIEVSDTGPGMDDETIVRVLDRTVKEKRGIGVSNTHRRLIQLYWQGLAIESKPGEGTKVSFFVPR